MYPLLELLDHQTGNLYRALLFIMVVLMLLVYLIFSLSKAWKAGSLLDKILAWLGISAIFYLSFSMYFYFGNSLFMSPETWREIILREGIVIGIPGHFIGFVIGLLLSVIAFSLEYLHGFLGRRYRET
ncbi:hypothetical protein [Infirmifilum sp. SLHALR2]|nr:MAG: hypothetical protein B7L53_00045 [Thermofilum sp. NZ13]